MSRCSCSFLLYVIFMIRFLLFIMFGLMLWCRVMWEWLVFLVRLVD